jgi:ATP-binding cassette subfamily F protein uup
LLVSHDRDFLDRVATTTIAMEGDGQATAYAGGWSDYRAQRVESSADESKDNTAKTKRSKAELKQEAANSSGLSFTQKHRLETLPAEMERLQAEIAKLEELMADADLFTREPAKFSKASDALVARHTALQEAEEEWLALAEKAED